MFKRTGSPAREVGLAAGPVPHEVVISACLNSVILVVILVLSTNEKYANVNIRAVPIVL